MSRRSSNAVKLARSSAARVGTVLDRNGFPVLDDPKRANKLPKKCQGPHHFVRVGRRYVGRSEFDPEFERYEIESRCVYCPEKMVETEIE